MEQGKYEKHLHDKLKEDVQQLRRELILRQDANKTELLNYYKKETYIKTMAFTLIAILVLVLLIIICFSQPSKINDEQMRIYYKERLELLIKEEIANTYLKDDWKTKFETIHKEITNIETHTQGDVIGRELKQYLLYQEVKLEKKINQTFEEIMKNIESRLTSNYDESSDEEHRTFIYRAFVGIMRLIWYIIRFFWGIVSFILWAVFQLFIAQFFMGIIVFCLPAAWKESLEGLERLRLQRLTQVRADPQNANIQRSSSKQKLNSTCELKMTNFSKYKTEKNQWNSTPWYTAPYGYKLQLNVDPCGFGNGKDTHISVHVYLMKGENDAMLQWPFSGDITIQLLNWREDRGHVEKTVHFNDNTSLQTRSMVIRGERASNGRGYDKFISLTDLSYNSLKNTEYLCNDTLRFKVTVN